MTPSLPDHDLILHTHGDLGLRLIFIEPYLNASHRALARGLMHRLTGRWTLLALPGRHFRWRMRGAAAYLAGTAKDILAQPWDGLVCSSMLNLAELVGLVPELAKVPALVYFHENQLAYPAPGEAVAKQRERDLYLAWTNLTSAQCARAAAFNSHYHRSQFFAAARELLAALPDCRPDRLLDDLEAKSRVLPVPLETEEAAGLEREPRGGPLRILWNHRWSQDKDPRTFFQALGELAGNGSEFEVAVLGLRSGRWPEVFDRAGELLGQRLVHLGPVEDRRQYWQWLFWADVAVSAALQEYQGLALAEAVWAGCRPLAPRALVYPELYPDEYLYDKGELTRHLARLTANPQEVRGGDFRPLVANRTWSGLNAEWAGLMAGILIARGEGKTPFD